MLELRLLNGKWETASELNFYFFQIERSEDLISWNEVANISAKGNSNVLTKYQITDSKPIRGTSYYRLLQYDLNGDYERFNPISLECDFKNFSVVLFPNPSDGEVNIKVESNLLLEGVNGNLYDISGKILYTEKMNFGIGTTQYSFSNLKLPKGSYILQLNHPAQEIRILHFTVK